MTAAALVAFAALTVSSGLSPVLPLLALGLLATYAADARIEPPDWWVHWLIRLALFSVIALLTANKPNEGLVDSIFGATQMDTVGQCAAAELVIQAWRRQSSENAQVGPSILLSGLTLVAACQTSDEFYPRLFVPTYMAFLLLSLNQSRHGMAAVRWAALAAALAAGAATYIVVWNNRVALSEWSVKYLEGRGGPEGTGLSADPVLGDTFGLRGSPQRVLRITGLNGITYLRDMPFDTYLHGRWGPEIDRRSYVPALAAAHAAGARAHVIPLAVTGGLLFAPINSAGLDLKDNADVQWAPDAGGPLLGRLSEPEPYDIIQSTDEDHQGPLASPLTAEERQRCLTLPTDLDRRIRALALRVAGREHDPRRRITRVVDYLVANHRYSLTYHSDQNEDPLASFLLQTPPPAAHCEYFASSATILLRCLGVPVRYVIGYYAHERDERGVVIVRQRDAHAWAEAWLDGTGWVTVDATPGDGRPDQDEKSVPLWQRLMEELADRGVALRTWLLGLNWPLAAVWLTGTATFLGLVSALWRRLRASLKAHVKEKTPGYSTRGSELEALAAHFEQILAQRGVPCPPGRPWQEHLAAVGLSEGGAGAFVRAYYQDRFGSSAQEYRAHLAALLAEAERQLEQTKDQG